MQQRDTLCNPLHEIINHWMRGLHDNHNISRLSFSLSLPSYLLLLHGSERAMEYLMAVDLNMSDGSKCTCERRLCTCGGIN